LTNILVFDTVPLSVPSDVTSLISVQCTTQLGAPLSPITKPSVLDSWGFFLLYLLLFISDCVLYFVGRFTKGDKRK